MKKIAILTALFALSGSAFANFNGANNSVSTVSAAKSMADDTYVTLEGSIVSQVKNDKYIFRDSTGEITVEIDGEDWGGVNVGPNDRVRIYGEVDKELMRATEIEVKRVEKLN